MAKEIFERICKICGKIFYCEGDCGYVESPHDRCRCAKCIRKINPKASCCDKEMKAKFVFR